MNKSIKEKYSPRGTLCVQLSNVEWLVYVEYFITYKRIRIVCASEILCE